MNSRDRKHFELSSNGAKKRLLLDDELKDTQTFSPSMQTSTPILTAKQPLYMSPVDEGYGSFQSSSGLSASQTSPDSTNLDLRYSPEFLASVQAAMHIFQQNKHQTKSPSAGAFSSSPYSAFSRWNGVQGGTGGCGGGFADSEMLIQRLLTQLRSNMLKMVDNSLAQIECSLRSQNIDKESLLGYLGQATTNYLPPSNGDTSNVHTLFNRLPNPRHFMDSVSHSPSNFTSRKVDPSSQPPPLGKLHDSLDESNLSDDYLPRLPASSLFDEEKSGPPTAARIGDQNALNMSVNSILTTAHLKKAKLMFLFVRYPNSSLLKSYFPNVRFNRNNTAQLIKWFSNFREFLYINVEKYIRQLLSNGVSSLEEVEPLSPQHELMRTLLMHYNRGKDIETPKEFFVAVEKAVEEFFTAIKQGEDSKQSWKKPIYKVIAQYDQELPNYFR